MIPVLITNEITNVCVKVNKVETTDFTYNLTFRYDNHSLTSILSKLKGSTFHVLSDANGNTIIALPLEGWDCTIVTDEDYIANNNRTPLLMLEQALHYKNDDMFTKRNIMVTYIDKSGDYAESKICKIECAKIPNGIAANITVINDEVSVYFMMQGIKLTKMFRKFKDYPSLYKYLLTFAIGQEHRIKSIDEITTSFCEI